MVSPPLRYRPAWWLPSPHLQTLWGRFARSRELVDTTILRLDTTDDDFLELHRIAPSSPTAPHVLILHGLEGGIRSHYAQGLLANFQQRGWGADLMLHRSCGVEMNRARRFYHSGETSDLALAIAHITAERPAAPLALAGVSLGGNVILKYLGEQNHALPQQIVIAAAVSVPFNLALGSRYIQNGFSRLYERHFLTSLKAKVRTKLRHFPDLISPDALDQITTLYDFDDQVTAQIHGFGSADHYYAESSSLQFLSQIKIKTLLLSAVDDPFLPSFVLDEVRTIARTNQNLILDFPEFGGHVGFVSGRNPFRPSYYLEQRVGEFFAANW